MLWCCVGWACGAYLLLDIHLLDLPLAPPLAVLLASRDSHLTGHPLGGHPGSDCAYGYAKGSAAVACLAAVQAGLSTRDQHAFLSFSTGSPRLSLRRPETRKQVRK